MSGPPARRPFDRAIREQVDGRSAPTLDPVRATSHETEVGGGQVQGRTAAILVVGKPIEVPVEPGEELDRERPRHRVVEQHLRHQAELTQIRPSPSDGQSPLHAQPVVEVGADPVGERKRCEARVRRKSAQVIHHPGLVSLDRAVVGPATPYEQLDRLQQAVATLAGRRHHAAQGRRSHSRMRGSHPW